MFDIPSTIDLSLGKVNGFLIIHTHQPQKITHISLSIIESIETEEGNKESVIGASNLTDKFTDKEQQTLPFTIFLHRKIIKSHPTFPIQEKSTQRLKKLRKSLDLLNSSFYIKARLLIEGENEPYNYEELINIVYANQG